MAIKKLRSGTTNVDEFLKEAQLMKGLFHPKIVNLEAVCTLTEPFLIVTEFMSHGSLLDFLRDETRATLDVPQHVYIAAQVSHVGPCVGRERERRKMINIRYTDRERER